MNWFTTGAIVIAVAFALNSAVFVRRAKLRGASGRGAVSPIRQPMSGLDIVLMLAMVVSWVVGLALPVVAPETPLGQFMSQRWAMPSLFAWSVFVVTVVRIARAVAVHLRYRRPGLGEHG